MFCRFLIPLKPLSVNKLYRVFRGRSIKSQDARAFEAMFNSYLAEFATQAILFMENFDREEDAIFVEYVFYLRSDEYFTKSGRLSMRCLDVDNAIKIAQDNLFAFIDLDDGYVTRISATKVPSDSDCIEIMLRKVKQPRKVINPEAKALLGGEQFN